MKLIEVTLYTPRPWHNRQDSRWQVSHNNVVVAEFPTEADATEYANRLYFAEV